MKYFIYLLFCVMTIELTAAVVNLDNFEQPFVLKTKRIHIPQYPEAFNPSIVRWKNKILMSFRTRDPLTTIATQVGFVWLDKKFDPISEPVLLQTAVANEYIQDPRLFVVKDKLYMAYSDLLTNPLTRVKKRIMCIAEIFHDETMFLAVNQSTLFHFDGNTHNKFEKNWVPFNYNDILLLSYSLSPHKVFLPILEENRCATIAETLAFNPWAWGELRGGTTALPIDKHHYLGFFHSSISMASVQSNSISMVHYFMGAYVFESSPPFALKKLSPYPILNKDFYNGREYKTWKPLKSIFPGGFIYDNNSIWVSYGRQDYEAWVVKLDKQALLKSLVSVESNP